ncbi:hypothetical protein CAOG_05056 [Capsaspora owczarzaki ATCC 30864]|uniref:hypothetical protein n=1 Tax=Capsaspora owczarzaki (strain ATCC 30864) TaxID=595528 RepID=UPI0003521394|nr:hypothetical protein CAOG_05056 [Capsaspora owczarzaki ATCC 30864]|eukprot:XP_004346741.2 hypothetical protein CAOG_05056 [Capsaspora owczarzaki ATCC 30864]
MRLSSPSCATGARDACTFRACQAPDKTATVHAVIRSLQQEVDDRNLDDFICIEINGMKLTDPQQAYATIWKHLTGQKVTAAHAAQLLEKRFSASSSASILSDAHAGRGRGRGTTSKVGLRREQVNAATRAESVGAGDGDEFFNNSSSEGESSEDDGDADDSDEARNRGGRNTNPSSNSFQLVEDEDGHVTRIPLRAQQSRSSSRGGRAATRAGKRESQTLRSQPKQKSIVLIVDELDLLVTKKQSVLYNMFEWPTRRGARLIALAIANTMDLPERHLSNRIQSRMGPTRLTFEPYTFKQLELIVQSRLEGIVHAFDAAALTLCTRKVAAVSGDARRALDICRRATEIAEAAHRTKRTAATQDGGDAQTESSELDGFSVTIESVDSAIAELFASPSIMAMQTASVQERTFLCAILSEFGRTGLEEATFGKLFTRHVGICRIRGIPAPSTSAVAAICARLGASRLLLVENGANDLYQRVRLNVSQSDVTFALRDDATLKRVVGPV